MEVEKGIHTKRDKKSLASSAWKSQRLLEQLPVNAQGVSRWEGRKVFNWQGNIGRRMIWHKRSQIITCWSIEDSF